MTKPVLPYFFNNSFSNYSQTPYWAQRMESGAENGLRHQNKYQLGGTKNMVVLRKLILQPRENNKNNQKKRGKYINEENFVLFSRMQL